MLRQDDKQVQQYKKKTQRIEDWNG